jgi:hypothetical protein
VTPKEFPCGHDDCRDKLPFPTEKVSHHSLCFPYLVSIESQGASQASARRPGKLQDCRFRR